MTIPRMSEERLPRISMEQLQEQMERLVEHYGYPGTPRNETGFSPTYFADWWEIFKPYTYNQVKKAVSAHINANDSLKGVFPLPGRIRKLITYDEDEHRMLHEDSARIEAERKAEAERLEKERFNSLSKEEQEKELAEDKRRREEIRQMLLEKGIISE